MQERDSFRLVVRRGPQPNQIYEITKDVTTLGRDITNDIVINDREASRHHLRLVRSGDSITVEDLGSTNGTFVNGKRVSGVTPLQNGDMVGLGETVTLGFEIQRAQQAQQAPPPQQPQQPVTSPPPPQPEIPGDQYAPPAPQQPPQQQDYAYQQPQQQPNDPYAPPSSDPYQQGQPAPEQNYQGYQQQQPQQQQGQGYYGQADASYGTPAPPQQYPGYDYDPYAMREDESGGSSRWLILGCLVFFLLACACFSIIGLVLIDTLNLWCEAPGITQIVSALGYCTVGG